MGTQINLKYQVTDSNLNGISCVICIFFVSSKPRYIIVIIIIVISRKGWRNTNTFHFTNTTTSILEYNYHTYFMSTVPVKQMMRSSYRNRPTKNMLVSSQPSMKDDHHKQLILPKFVTLPSERVPMGRRISNDSCSNISSNTNTSSNSKVVVVEEEEEEHANDHLEGRSNGRHRLHHPRRHSDSQMHSRNPKLRPPSTPDSVASSSTKSQNKLSTIDTYRPAKHSTNKKCETLPPPKPKSILYTMFFNNNSSTKRPKKKKNTVICKDVSHQYNENGVLRRTTVIRKKRPNGTTTARTHREFISPTNPMYINNTMTTKRK
jgi:hypothetical protein